MSADTRAAFDAALRQSGAPAARILAAVAYFAVIAAAEAAALCGCRTCRGRLRPAQETE